MEKNGALIKAIVPNSIGAELGLEPGDRLLSINRILPQDFIDYLMHCAEESLTLEVLKVSGDLEEIEFEKDPEEQLGIEFEDALFDGIRECTNHCLFCFVHQLPSGQRPSLYIMDDDYRFSFLHGAYITLTNLAETDWKRIERLHLNPLYISVHATDPVVRQQLLGSKKAGRIMEQLKRLAAMGITVHTQAVVCPGINDGPILERTISDLAQLWPAVASLAVVPVGLTQHREKLYRLREFAPDEAARVIETIQQFQKQFLVTFGSRFVFTADEWYITAGLPFPANEEYEDYLQLDNGVGLARWFLTEFYETFPATCTLLSQIQRKLVIITGVSALGLWQEIQNYLSLHIPSLQLEIIPVRNRFLGPSVTVSGLMGGRDIREAVISHQNEGDPAYYLIPQIALKQDANLFLDGLSLDQLLSDCRLKQIAVVPTRARDWLNWLTDNILSLKN